MFGMIWGDMKNISFAFARPDDFCHQYTTMIAPMISQPHHPLLTLEQVMGWRDRVRQIGDVRRALDDEEADLSRKLEAVKVLFGDIPNEETPSEEPAVDAGSPEPDDQADAEPFQDVILKAVGVVGGAPEPKVIRRWIAAHGSTQSIRERADKQYFYTCLMRHAQNGRLVKVGDGYALPTSSPQGETEGLAPSASVTAENGKTYGGTEERPEAGGT